MRPHPTIGIVVVYFGPPPLWLPAFFLSCRGNPEVQWLLLTDWHAMPTPDNVTIRPFSQAELAQRVRERVNIDIDLSADPRKVCDVRPVFGVIFEDLLRPFDFWGFSDLDIVWGNIQSFLTEDVLNDYDIVSTRRHKIAGPLTLFRNRRAINRVYRLMPQIDDGLRDPRHLRLDERPLTMALRRRLHSRWPLSRPRVYWSRDLTMSAAYQRGLEPGWSLVWRNGRTFDAHGQELMYLHFNKLKNKIRSIDFGFGDTPPAFVLRRGGVFASSPDESSIDLAPMYSTRTQSRRESGPV